MPTYRFTGTTTEWFPTLGELAPGDTVEAGEEVAHPRLELVTDKPAVKLTTAAASAAADTVKEA